MNQKEIAKNVDEEYVKDLYLSAVNTGSIYEHCGKYCIANLQKKVKKGVYDETKAPKIFMSRFLELARDEYLRTCDIRPRMSAAAKEMFGKLVLDFYREEIFQ